MKGDNEDKDANGEASPVTPSSPPSEVEQAVDDFFASKVWQSTSSGYMLNNSTKQEDNTDESPTQLKTTAGDAISYNALTYGEVSIGGARQLFRHMGITGRSPQESYSPIVFMDLGSGCGRLVMQAFLELPCVSKSMGIEVSCIRHESAVRAWDRLQSRAKEIRQMGGGSGSATIELMEGDFLQADLSEVTHIFLSSLCFPDDLMYQIAEKLHNETPPNLQCVATLKQFPMEFERRGIKDRIHYELIYKTFGLTMRTEEVDMSWTKHRPSGCQVFFYNKPTN